MQYYVRFILPPPYNADSVEHTVLTEGEFNTQAASATLYAHITGFAWKPWDGNFSDLDSVSGPITREFNGKRKDNGSSEEAYVELNEPTEYGEPFGVAIRTGLPIYVELSTVLPYDVGMYEGESFFGVFHTGLESTGFRVERQGSSQIGINYLKLFIGEEEGPVEPESPFWTNFVHAYEALSASTETPPVAPDNPVNVASLPFSMTLDEFSATATWFKVTLAAGAYRFSTADSLSQWHDTRIALFNAAGDVLDIHDDIDTSGGDYRSQIEITLVADTYYLAVGGYSATGPAGVSDGFIFDPGVDTVPAGTVVTIEAI